MAIIKVDYGDMATYAKQIRELAKDLNGYITKAYNEIDTMSNIWYGKRYNALVKEFNDMVPQINSLLVLVVGKLPYALEKIANNYSMADKGANITSAVETSPNRIQSISLSNNEGLKFIEADVENVRKNVSSYFSNVIDKMGDIEDKFDLITWDSEAATTFRTKFKKIKSNIVSSFGNVKTSFVNIMNQAKEDMQAAETANTVD